MECMPNFLAALLCTQYNWSGTAPRDIRVEIEAIAVIEKWSMYWKKYWQKTCWSCRSLLQCSFFLLLPLIPPTDQNHIGIDKSDTTENQSSLNDTLGVRGGKIKLISDVPSKSGSLAMLFLLAAGAGQVYAHRYYTIPIFWGFGVYFSSVAIKANKQYEDYRGKFRNQSD